jgi:hypothetical protein
MTGEGIRCRMTAEREIAEEKQIPRFARGDNDGIRRERQSTDAQVGHYKTSPNLTKGAHLRRRPLRNPAAQSRAADQWRGKSSAVDDLSVPRTGEVKYCGRAFSHCTMLRPEGS